MSIGDFLACPNCGGKGGYHNSPCSGALPYQSMPTYAPNPPGARPSPVPVQYLTADDVRRIVREELTKPYSYDAQVINAEPALLPGRPFRISRVALVRALREQDGGSYTVNEIIAALRAVGVSVEG